MNRFLKHSLKDRIQNKHFIVNSHMNGISSMEMSMQDAAKSLRVVVDK